MPTFLRTCRNFFGMYREPSPSMPIKYFRHVSRASPAMPIKYFRHVSRASPVMPKNFGMYRVLGTCRTLRPGGGRLFLSGEAFANEPSSDQPAVTRSRLAGRGGNDAARSSKATVSVLERYRLSGYTFASLHFCRLRRNVRPIARVRRKPAETMLLARARPPSQYWNWRGLGGTHSPHPTFSGFID